MPRNAIPASIHQRSSGYSLVELVAATALVAGTLVPALELVRDGIDLSEETTQRQLLANYAVSQLEQRLCLCAATWTTGTFTGSYTAEGHAEIRYATTCSDDPTDGGIVGLLMDLRTTTYVDSDGDGTQGAFEPSCSYRTKLGKFASYEALIP